MPKRNVPGTNLSYYLVVFDKDGRERPEDGGLPSATVVDQLTADAGQAGRAVTDIVFASHGWLGDVPGAIAQYDRWFAAMLTIQADLAAAGARPEGFRPPVIGLHWPSLPWGDESLPPAGGGVLSGEADTHGSLDAYASRIADTPAARQALATILAAAAKAQDTTLKPDLLAAFHILFAESGLGTDGEFAGPGSDQDGFDPQVIIADATQAGSVPAAAVTGAPGVLGGGVGDRIKDILLAPVRQLSFWAMKDRARLFGESGAHKLLRTLQHTAPNANFHLMGHSFGCIVVSGAVVGGAGTVALPRPVESLLLVQGALSLWSAGSDIPYAPGQSGYFRRLLDLVSGPIVTTRSDKDFAVGRLYPLGARVKKQLLLDPPKLPAYGGVGSFGLQGLATPARDVPIQSDSFAYGFEPGQVYNIDASRVIATLDGPGGAHSDIAHSEVAHLQLEAILSLQ